MYVKWIVCNVRENLRKEFADTQEKWIETQDADGFIGQVGGWDLNNKNDACIISFWEHKESLQSFMRNIHDKIFYGNEQSKLYESISVVYFESEFDMEGSSSSLAEAIRLGKLLRVADCWVNQERIAHFEEVQQTIWLPGMKKANGMLGGLFSKEAGGISRYLVSTFWDSVENHNNYVKRNLPIFRKEAQVAQNLDTMVGRQVLLIDSWSIIS